LPQSTIWICLRDSMLVPDGPSHFTARLHLYAQPSLLRGALEEWSEVRDLETTRTLAGSQPSDKDMGEHFEELSDLARAAGVEPAEIKQRPGYGKIVEDAADRIGAPDPKAVAAVWKACSSLAHGDLRGVLAHLPKDVQHSDTPGMVFSRSAPNVDLMATVTVMAVGTTRRAFDLFRRRAGTSVAA
jgi:hypothetical protein